MLILMVDDDYNKAEAVSTALKQDAAVGPFQLIHETTAQAARARLRTVRADLLVIDLHLPDAVGAESTEHGGLLLFEIMCLDERVHLPEDVVFLSGREELLEKAASKVAALGAMLLQYRSDLSLWSSALTGRVKYIAKRRQREAGGIPKQVDIVLVTALRAPELDAVLQLPYAWKAERLAGDPTPYFLGSISRDRSREPLTIVSACATRKGMPSAGALAARMCTLFKPRFLVMTGICAGIAAKTGLGDVIVADPTWDCGSGKQSEDEDGGLVFRAAPYQRPLDANVMNIASELARDPAAMQAIRSAWTGRVPAGILGARVGPMASGASVVAAKEFAASISGQHKDLLAIEMEGYAVMAASEYATAPAPIAIVIKSVCDFADAGKNDDWQAYAAYTSAAFADQMFRHGAFSA